MDWNHTGGFGEHGLPRHESSHAHRSDGRHGPRKTPPRRSVCAPHDIDKRPARDAKHPALTATTPAAAHRNARRTSAISACVMCLIRAA